MKELDECLKAKREIDDINEKIDTLRAAILSPKNQVITGMPRGGNNDNAIERYLLKVEKLEKRRTTLINYQLERWELIEDKNLPEQEQRLLFLRFMLGYSWKKCCARLHEEYGGWNIDKIFRVYRSICKKL